LRRVCYNAPQLRLLTGESWIGSVEAVSTGAYI
jgi:hypothetical protein